MPRTHTVPTHLRTPETVVSFSGVSLSARQFLLLLLGSALGYDLWVHLAAFAHVPLGQVARFALALVPLVGAAALAFLRLAEREVFTWLLVFLRFAYRPRRFVWRSVRFQEPSLILDGAASPKEEAEQNE